MIPELVGRTPVITVLEPLDQDALVTILTEPKNSMVKQYKQMFQLDNIRLDFDPAALQAIAKQAIERKTGARGLLAVMEDVLSDVMYEAPSDYTVESVTVTEDSVSKKKRPIFTYDTTRKPQRLLITTNSAPARARSRRETAS